MQIGAAGSWWPARKCSPSIPGFDLLTATITNTLILRPAIAACGLDFDFFCPSPCPVCRDSQWSWVSTEQEYLTFNLCFLGTRKRKPAMESPQAADLGFFSNMEIWVLFFSRQTGIYGKMKMGKIWVGLRTRGLPKEGVYGLA